MPMNPPAAAAEPASALNANAEGAGQSIEVLSRLKDSRARFQLEAWMSDLEVLFREQGIGETSAQWFSWGVAAVVILVVCVLTNYLAKLLLRAVVHPPLRRHESDWSDALVASGVFTRLSQLAPVIILAVGVPLIVDGWGLELALDLINLYALWVLLHVSFGIVDLVGDLYDSRKGQDRSPIAGLLQACKLVLTIIVGLLFLSILFSKSPVYFISGLGAFTAIVLLIFRDTILGFVAGLQLAANDMVRVGDWIEIPGTRVDGDVVGVTLTTVRIENWDKTIAMVPAYDLFQKSFVNWRGMADSGGRRIKRSINIDISTIRFATEEMLRSWSGITLLHPYLEAKTAEVEAWNRARNISPLGDINGRQQTNIGAFRAYVEAYLRSHPQIHQTGFTFLVRQLQPTGEGLPLEIYVFTTDNRWVQYEGIQADIFDHLLAMVDVFGLAVHESPSGSDVRHLGTRPIPVD